MIDMAKYKLNLRDSLLLGKYFRVMEQFDSTLAGSIGKCKFSEKFEELLFWRGESEFFS